MMRTLSAATMVAMLVWVVGCSDTSVDSRQAASLETEFGGYTVSQEAPAFGDPLLAAEGSGDVEYTDPVASSLVIDSLMRDPQAGLYHLRIVWGRLQWDSTVTTPTEWSGSLTISRGGVLLRRIIRFEPDTDQILPRTDRHVLEWTSVTTVHHDGIAVDLVVPPAGPILDTTYQYVVDTTGDTTDIIVTVDTIPAAPVTVEFKTSPYSRTFTLEELARLDTIVYLGDSNAVAFHAFRLERMRCPRGFVSGHWVYDSTGQGVFRGTWIGQHGVIEGHLQGHFEEDSLGRKLFFGKWIDESGNFEGLLRGRWGRMPDMHADSTAMLRAGGWFRGAIFDRDANPIGAIGGHFRSWEGERPGFFQGRWKVGCMQPEGDRPEDGMGDMQRDGMGDGFSGGFSDRGDGGMGQPGGRR